MKKRLIAFVCLALIALGTTIVNASPPPVLGDNIGRLTVNQSDFTPNPGLVPMLTGMHDSRDQLASQGNIFGANISPAASFQHPYSVGKIQKQEVQATAGLSTSGFISISNVTFDCSQELSPYHIGAGFSPSD